MKTENNLQNKAAFIAQYWGQTVMSIPNRYNLFKLFKIGFTYMKTESVQSGHLKLTPLDQLTDQHAMLIHSIMEGMDILKDEMLTGDDIIELKEAITHLAIPSHEDTDFDEISCHPGIVLEAYDKLRELEYAVPWRDLSVDDLIAYGWVKLKQ